MIYIIKVDCIFFGTLNIKDNHENLIQIHKKARNYFVCFSTGNQKSF